MSSRTWRSTTPARGPISSDGVTWAVDASLGRCTTTWHGGTLEFVPTTRPRTQLTHTAAVERALEVAARRWPGEKDSVLLTRLIEAGADAIEASAELDREQRRRRALALSSKYRGTFADGYLDEMRAGWPE